MTENFLARLNELPLNLASHLMLVVIALGVGVLISVPLAVVVSRVKALRYPVLTAAGVIQTIPSIALLALMVPILDYTGGFGLGLAAFGFYPAVIALTLYSFLPILRNTVTGIDGVDPAMVEAARGMGMTERQMLLKVQLPLAAPVIIAGIRTSTVWIVGIATLATPVGQRCLGNFIFTGLQTRNWLMVMFGVVGAAVLAILLDLLIGGLQTAADQRRKGLGVLCGSLVLAVIVGGIASPTVVRWVSTDQLITAQETQAEQARRTKIAVGGAATPSQRLVRSALLDGLIANDYQPQPAAETQTTDPIQALADDRLQVYLDFGGRTWRNAPDALRAASRWHTIARFNGWLAEEHGIRAVGPFGRPADADAGVPFELTALIGPTVADAPAMNRAVAPLYRRFRHAGHPSLIADADEEPKPKIVVGAKTFTEQFILAELIRRRLAEAGFESSTTEGLGSTMAFDALTTGDVGVYVDYSGTIWANYMKRDQIKAAWHVRTLATRWLADTHRIRHLGPLGFENTYVLVMPRDRADELGIETIDDLAEHSADMTIGGDYEFFGRPEWQKLRKTYGLNFTETRNYDASLMYDAVVQGQVDVIAAFSTNGQIAAFDLKVIEDPRNAVPPYEAMVLINPDLADRDDVARALLPLLRSIDADLMRRANHMVDRDEDKKTVQEAAAWLDQRIGG